MIRKAGQINFGGNQDLAIFERCALTEKAFSFARIELSRARCIRPEVFHRIGLRSGNACSAYARTAGIGEFKAVSQPRLQKALAGLADDVYATGFI